LKLLIDLSLKAKTSQILEENIGKPLWSWGSYVGHKKHEK
jgi:hypothetical protein